MRWGQERSGGWISVKMKGIITQDGGGRGLKLRVKCGFSRSALRKLHYS